MKKCVVKLIWLDNYNKEEYCEYIIMDLDLKSSHREQSIYSQIYNKFAHEGPIFDSYKYQEIHI